ncbi:hypothetical protein [Streptacidiphilus sp. MAP12-33]|uniref:hypothetical protein n=1 Tax=Streptacidiphilus sp. MAP12-33 TaxID=3156266 RepID=UPI003519A720
MVAGHEATSAEDFVALALGIDRELFTGTPDETPMDREARMDVASAILAELYENDRAAWRYARELLRTAPVPLRRRPAPRPRTRARVVRSAVA